MFEWVTRDQSAVLGLRIESRVTGFNTPSQPLLRGGVVASLVTMEVSVANLHVMGGWVVFCVVVG